MSIDERLRIMKPFGPFNHEAGSIESPNWHGDVLAQRKAKLESGDAKFISLETLKAYYFAKN
ncbi:MAG: addiction module protein [Haliea sp.]|nr:addiction module protein [Haliea sp.]